MQAVPRRRHRATSSLVALACLTLLAGYPLPEGAGGSPRGFLQIRAATVLQREATLVALPTAESVRRLAREIGTRPAVAGTPAMTAGAEQLRGLLRGWGLEVSTHEYDVYLPHARRVSVQRLAPEPLELPLLEESVEADPDAAAAQYPAVAGYSAAGDVSAAVAYVNYGTDEDFTKLRLAGGSVDGKVALVRYGNGFRGAKVRNAVAAGAVAVLLYSDPHDDGYYRGDVYPEGPFRPWSGIQRGSVKVGAPGDPTTPGWPSLPGAQRVEPGAGVPAVPVVPISYGAATEIMRHLGGAEAPPGWQGALPFRYHVGAGRVRVRVQVELDEEPYKRIRNTVGWLRGSSVPDEWVIVGAHRDSWTGGAVDNVSGTVSVLEAARALAAMRDAGHGPQRTIVFAFWDAEEWGLLGSAEWVEELAEQLEESAVAYINQDGIAGGPFFAAVASPALESLLVEVTDAVPDPVLPSSSVHAGWRRRTGTGPGKRVPIGTPGGGSDYASFLGRLGIPSVGFGFTGAHGVYHSAYDTAEFMRRFGDPGYRQHRAAAAITALLAWRLADADLLPLDYLELAQTVGRWTAALERQAAERRWGERLGLARLGSAISRLRLAAADYDSAARVAVAGAGVAPLATAARVNEQLRSVSRELLADPDARSSAWFRNLLMAPDPADAYSAQTLPAIAGALRSDDPLAAAFAVDELAGKVDAAATRLNVAAALLGRSAIAAIPAR